MGVKERKKGRKKERQKERRTEGKRKRKISSLNEVIMLIRYRLDDVVNLSFMVTSSLKSRQRTSSPSFTTDAPVVKFEAASCNVQSISDDEELEEDEPLEDVSIPALSPPRAFMGTV